MPARLIEYQSGLDAALAAPPMQQVMYRKMQRAHNYARIISPYRTGRFALRSFQIVVGVRGDPPRAYGRLINNATDPDTGYHYAVALEFGRKWIDQRTGKPREIKRQRILARAADALRD